MTVEQFVDDEGRVRERLVRSAGTDVVQVVRVESVSPPMVRVKGRRQPVRVAGFLAGALAGVSVGDFVLAVKVEQGVIAIGRVQVL